LTDLVSIKRVLISISNTYVLQGFLC